MNGDQAGVAWSSDTDLSFSLIPAQSFTKITVHDEAKRFSVTLGHIEDFPFDTY